MILLFLHQRQIIRIIGGTYYFVLNTVAGRKRRPCTAAWTLPNLQGITRSLGGHINRFVLIERGGHSIEVNGDAAVDIGRMTDPYANAGVHFADELFVYRGEFGIPRDRKPIGRQRCRN